DAAIAAAPATPASSTLSLHDALPISEPDDDGRGHRVAERITKQHSDEHGRLPDRQRADAIEHAALHFAVQCVTGVHADHHHGLEDRKSTRLNSSHVKISYAVFCLKKK